MDFYQGLSARFYDANNCVFGDELHYYLRRFSKNDVVLEPMCGSGRLTVPLLKAGLNVEGLDASAEMLALLRKRVPGATLHQKDIGTFCLEKQYDGVIIPYCSLNHLLDLSFLQTVFENIFAHLAPGGGFLFETFHEGSEWPWTDGQIKISDRIRETCLSKRRLHGHTVSMRYRYVLTDAQELPTGEPEHKTLRSRFFETNALLTMLCSIGFESVRVFPCADVYGLDHLTEAESANTVFFEAFKPRAF